MQAESGFRFVPADNGHVRLLSEWFERPHVKQWWSDGSDALSRLQPGGSDPNCWPFVAYQDVKPIAYIQSWSPSQTEDYPWQKDFGSTTRGMDLFIGPPNLLNRGVGPRLICAFVRKLKCEGAGRIVIDPNISNARAIRAYEKSGFRRIGEVRDVDGTSLLMELAE